jgi:hypothetical protein
MRKVPSNQVWQSEQGHGRKQLSDRKCGKNGMHKKTFAWLETAWIETWIMRGDQVSF